MNNNFDLLVEKIENELETFRDSYKNFNVIQTYNDWYIIGFYEAYYDFLTSDYLNPQQEANIISWLASMDKPLESLYMLWEDNSKAFSHDWDDMFGWLCEAYEEQKAAGNMQVVEGLIAVATEKSDEQRSGVKEVDEYYKISGSFYDFYVNTKTGEKKFQLDE
ncbi:hypothetical protein IJV79_00940, partial [bacterium]|nr:hypothetical protein [bacterium]